MREEGERERQAVSAEGLEEARERSARSFVLLSRASLLYASLLQTFSGFTLCSNSSGVRSRKKEQRKAGILITFLVRGKRKERVSE